MSLNRPIGLPWYESTIPARLAAQVIATPSSIAVMDDVQHITYSELARRTAWIAWMLRNVGVARDNADRVLLALGKSVDAIVALFGILRAGAAYVPVDPDSPRERNATIASKARARTVISSIRHCDLWPKDVKVICPETQDIPDGEPPAILPARIDARDVAYVIFTSGSTGEPKGVMVQHDAVLNLADSLFMTVYGGVTTPQRVSLNAPLTFDASVQQIVHVLRGDCLCIVPERVRRDGRLFLEFVQHSCLDLLDVTPAHLRMLLAAGLLDDEGHVPRRVLIGGDAIDVGTWRRLKSQSRVLAYNVYGPTECTVDSTCCEISSAPEWPVIGRALPGCEMRILSPDLVECPQGQIGEICIAGRGLALGYAEDPVLTAERFVEGCAAFQGQRMYRTGDLGRDLGDGMMEFIGRNDFQVKVRGHRVELGEVEAILREHPAVEDVVVTAPADASGDRRIVAYVVLRDIGILTSLETFCADRMSAAFVPAVFMPMGILPTTESGKVDRAALPSPYRVRPTLQTEYVAPATAIEATLAVVWNEVLNVYPVGTKDNFFDLGGDSLTALRLHEGAARCGIRVTLRAILENQTIAALTPLVVVGGLES